jgi:aminoglycoside 3-N-acetyltransferase
MTIESLADEWRLSGVEDGDVLLVHSSLKRTLIRSIRAGTRVTPHEILESFLAAIGPSGTLLLPLFNFDFTSGVPFDIRSTPSQMGALTEAGRVHPAAVRTGHPIYSFAVIGHRADEFRGVNNLSGYGDDSPFAMLRAMNGRIAVLSLPDQNSMTFYHHVEEMNDVSYRYHKQFTAGYTDDAGCTESKTYGLFVRDVEEGVQTHVDPAGERMWQAGLYSGSKPSEGCGLRTVLANDVFQFVSKIITTDDAEGVLYRREERAAA